MMIGVMIRPPEDERPPFDGPKPWDQFSQTISTGFEPEEHSALSSGIEPGHTVPTTHTGPPYSPAGQDWPPLFGSESGESASVQVQGESGFPLPGGEAQDHDNRSSEWSGDHIGYSRPDCSFTEGLEHVRRDQGAYRRRDQFLFNLRLIGYGVLGVAKVIHDVLHCRFEAPNHNEPFHLRLLCWLAWSKEVAICLMALVLLWELWQAEPSAQGLVSPHVVIFLMLALKIGTGKSIAPKMAAINESRTNSSGTTPRVNEEQTKLNIWLLILLCLEVFLYYLLIKNSHHLLWLWCPICIPLVVLMLCIVDFISKILVFVKDNFTYYRGPSLPQYRSCWNTQQNGTVEGGRKPHSM